MCTTCVAVLAKLKTAQEKANEAKDELLKRTAPKSYIATKRPSAPSSSTPTSSPLRKHMRSSLQFSPIANVSSPEI